MMRRWINMRAVLKFGGSSVQNIEFMKRVAKTIIEKKNTYDEIVVVLSAMGKTTNQLIQMAKDVTKYPNKRDVDLLISTGEVVSIALLRSEERRVGKECRSRWLA